MPLDATRANLDKMITAFQGAGARVVLAGMTLPPNYGADYIRGFENIYKDLAAAHKTTLIPFLLSDIVTKDLRYIQPDGLHPTAAGAEIVAGTVLRYIKPLLMNANHARVRWRKAHPRARSPCGDARRAPRGARTADGGYPRVRARNSSRVALRVRKLPSSGAGDGSRVLFFDSAHHHAEVTRFAQYAHPARRSRPLSIASATCCVNRSCNCSRRANMSTTRGILRSPSITLSLGR